MLTTAYCLVVGLGLWLRLDLVLGLLVSGYAHVFVLVSVVIVTLPTNSRYQCSLGAPP